MTEQEIVEYLKDNMSKGVAFMFLPEEVIDWVNDNFNDRHLLALQQDGRWELVRNHDYDDYDNIVFALPKYYPVKQESKGECEEDEESEQKNIADSMLLAARVLKSNCFKINCLECVLRRNEECLLNQHPSYWNLNGDDNED